MTEKNAETPSTQSFPTHTEKMVYLGIPFQSIMACGQSASGPPAWRCCDASRVRSSTLRREIEVPGIHHFRRKKNTNGSGLVSNGPSLAIFLRMQPPFLFGWEQLRSNLYTGKRKM